MTKKRKDLDELREMLSGSGSSKDALLKHLDKQVKASGPKRKNQKPEKEVEKQVITWLDKHGFSCHVVESKAVYSQSAGRYLRGQTVAGMPDIIGCDRFGNSVWIELKAPGRRSNLSVNQSSFLLNKAKLGCFSCVTDSVEFLSSLYDAWIEEKLAGNDREMIKILSDAMPKKRKNRANLDDDLGF